MQNIGICCHRYTDCGEEFSFQGDPDNDPDAFWKMEDAAGEAGWVIGHLDGQGHYAGPNCRDTIWQPMKLSGPPEATRKWLRSQRAAALAKASQ